MRVIEDGQPRSNLALFLEKSIKNGLMIKTEPVYCKWVCHKMAAVLIIIIWPGMSYCDTQVVLEQWGLLTLLVQKVVSKT